MIRSRFTEMDQRRDRVVDRSWNILLFPQKRYRAGDVTLDQSHATPETAVRKAMLLLEKGWLHRSIIFMGDDDLISVACYLVRQRFIPDHQTPGKLAAADIDTRYLEYIKEQTKASIETTVYDVRKPLPTEWKNRFQLAVTDPAYTVNGINTFASRCHDAVDENGILFLSIPQMDNQSAGLVQQKLLHQGWVLRESYSNFNEYLGASIHAHTSNLYLWEKWKASSQENQLDLSGEPFYTADVKFKR